MDEKYGLLFGGGYAIKEYYMESGNPRQMRGASELLIECGKMVKKHLLKNGITEENIFTSGATLVARLPKYSREKGEQIAAKAEQIFRETCRTAHAAFVTVPEDGKYTDVIKCAYAEYENRKASCFIPWAFQDDDAGDKIGKDDLMGKDDQTGYKKIAQGEGPARCPRCRLRTPRHHITHHNGEELYLCTSCAMREKESEERKYVMRTECGKENESGKQSESVFDYGFDINTVSDLCDGQGRVALLYADINNLGGYKHPEDFKFKDDKVFHDQVEKTVKTAVYTAIKTAMEPNRKKQTGQLEAKFEIIALGGDDICLLLPGDKTFLVAKTMAEVFDQQARGKELDLTISVSACVANDRTALTYMEKIVEDGLGRAKKCARKTNQSAITLLYFNHPSALFPMTIEEMNCFDDLLHRSSSVSSGAMRNIAEAYREMVDDKREDHEQTKWTEEESQNRHMEFDLFFRYSLSRDVKQTERAVLEEINQTYKGKREIDDKDQNIWSDFVIWRQLHADREEAENASH